MRAALAHVFEEPYSAPIALAVAEIHEAGAQVRFSAPREAAAIFDADWRQIGWRMGTLLDAARTLTRPETFNSFRGRSSNPLTASITAFLGAPAGTDDLVITQLAQKHQVITRGFSAPNAALGLSGTLTVNSAPIALEPGDALGDISAKIIAADAGVTAAIVTAGSRDYRLVLSASRTGLRGAIGLEGEFASAFIGDVVHAQDACFSLEGVPFTRPSNVVDDLLPGIVVTLFAGSADNPGRATLTVAPDVDKSVLAVSHFVAAFNDVQNLITELSFLRGAGEAIVGASTAPELPESLLTAVIGWDVDGALETIGIARDDWGLLDVDYGRLRAALVEAPAGVAALFGAIDWGQIYSDQFDDVEEVEGHLRLVTFSYEPEPIVDIPPYGVLDQLIDILGELLAPTLRAQAA